MNQFKTELKEYREAIIKLEKIKWKLRLIRTMMPLSHDPKIGAKILAIIDRI